MIASHRHLGTVLFAALVSVTAINAQAEDFRLLTYENHTIKWGAPALGQPATVTYALATSTMQFPKGRNCQTLAPMSYFLDRTGVTSDELRDALKKAIAVWTVAANIQFREISDPDKANIVFGGMPDDRGVAFTDVFYDTPPQPGTTPIPIVRSTVCLNTFKRWRTENDGNDETYTMTYVLAHEVGHTIGLDHPGVRGALMGFAYRDAPTELGAGDVAGIQYLYGPQQSPARPQPAPQASR